MRKNIVVVTMLLAACGGAKKKAGNDAVDAKTAAAPMMVNEEHADIVRHMYDDGLLNVPMVKDSSKAYLGRVAKGEYTMQEGAKKFDAWILNWIKAHPAEYEQAKKHPVERPVPRVVGSTQTAVPTGSPAGVPGGPPASIGAPQPRPIMGARGQTPVIKHN